MKKWVILRAVRYIFVVGGDSRPFDRGSIVIEHMNGEGHLIRINGFGVPGEDSRLVMNEKGDRGKILFNPDLSDDVLAEQAIYLSDRTMGDCPLKGTTFVCGKSGVVYYFQCNEDGQPSTSRLANGAPSWAYGL